MTEAPVIESGRCFLACSVNLAASRISAPSIASLLAMAGALPPMAILADGASLAAVATSVNNVAFATYRLKI